MLPHLVRYKFSLLSQEAEGVPTTVYSACETSLLGKAVNKTRKKHLNHRGRAVVSTKIQGMTYLMSLSSLMLAVPLYVSDSFVRPTYVHFVAWDSQEISLISLALGWVFL